MRWQETSAPRRMQGAQQQQCGYVCIQARLIFSNPGSMEEAHEYGLPRARCFVARRLELVAVSGRLWISWCVLGGPDIFVLFFVFNETRPKERSGREHYLPLVKNASSS